MIYAAIRNKTNYNVEVIIEYICWHALYGVEEHCFCKSLSVHSSVRPSASVRSSVSRSVGSSVHPSVGLSVGSSVLHINTYNVIVYMEDIMCLWM